MTTVRFSPLLLALSLAGAAFAPVSAQTTPSDGATVESPVAAGAAETGVPRSTADHTSLPELAGPFGSAREVNGACLSCHNTGPEQLHGTIHFTWEWPAAVGGTTPDDAAARAGMRHVANGFLLSTPSNLDSCTSCHIAGTRFDDLAAFDTSSAAVAPVDCLSCHEPTGQWAIANFHEGGAACSMCHDERLRGDTPEVADLAAAARSVGPTTRASCGSCHFGADGGPGVKHGDLSADLLDPPPTLDVHMAAAPDGAGFSCGTCHTATEHVIAGSRYADGPGDMPDRPALAGPAATCQGCHSDTPHEGLSSGQRLDRHTDRVACETCHIPSIARGETATRVFWDWSTVGKLGRDRKPMVQKDKEGNVVYTTEKGDLAAASNFPPFLVWSNGRLGFLRPGDAVPDTALVEATKSASPKGGNGPDFEEIETAFVDAPWIAAYAGDAADAKARIAPIKVMHSVVPVDAESRGLASVKFAGRSGDALWNRFRWKDAVETGMAASGVPFSGEVAFARVRQMIPVNHMVAPASQALDCGTCHARDGALAAVPGGFVPGRDRLAWLDKAGIGILAATLFAVCLHLLLRLGFAVYRRGKRHG